MKKQTREQIIAQYEDGPAWDDAAEEVEIPFKRPLDKVVPIRLSAEVWEELRKEGQDLGLGPSTLARMWILERLRVLRQLRSMPGPRLVVGTPDMWASGMNIGQAMTGIPADSPKVSN